MGIRTRLLQLLPRSPRETVHGLVPVLLVPTTMPLEMIAPGPAPALPRCQRPVAVHGLVPVLLVPTTMPLEMTAPGPAPALPRCQRPVAVHGLVPVLLVP